VGRTPVVVLYTAQGCRLCERARAVIEGLRAELEFELREVDITGDEGLEARYRELLPVVEIDGRRAFVYYVQPDAFRRRISARASGGDPAS
jgi:glutaredoxin